MADLKLNVLNHLPAGLLTASPGQLQELLGGPTLIHLDGQRDDALFVSIMLHGNEYTGLLALQRVLKKYATSRLPRGLSIFIGNVAAASENLRALPGQPDYNRIWGIGDTPEHHLTQRVMDEMRRQQVFAAIDVHNNTGPNPHYALVARLDNDVFQLATLFSRTVVYTRKPDTTSTWAMSTICPAVTLECGLPGIEFGVAHASEYIDACLHLSHIPEHPVAAHDMDLFHSVAIIKIPSEYNFSFDGSAADIVFEESLPEMNFTELSVDTRFCRFAPGTGACLEAWDEHGRNRAEEYFYQQGDSCYVRQPIMPAMLTMEHYVVRMDCLCYMMERLDWQHADSLPGEQVDAAGG